MLNTRVQKYLSKINPSISEHGKKIIIKCGLAVAASDGIIDDSEVSLINDIAQSMEMSSNHLKGILQEMPSEKPTFSQN